MARCSRSNAEAEIPTTEIAMPRCARLMPIAERGRLIARRTLSPTGMRNKRTRSANSVATPMPVQTATPSPNTASTGPPYVAYSMPSVNTTATANAIHNRCNAPNRSPRFQDSIGPAAMAISTGTMIGTNVRSKNGGPTETFGPPTASRNSGYSVPRNTVAAQVASSRLLSSNAPSRDTGANSPPPSSAGALMAYSVSEPPIATSNRIRMKLPRNGSTANACTELSTPERTRNVPTSDSEKVMIASRMVQLFSVSRRSTTMAEWISAVPTSHGIKDAFSTGSQKHPPPQQSV